MATGRYVRMVLTGDRPSGSFQGEIWQTGISMVDQDSGGVSPGGVREALPSFEATIIGQSTADATWRWDWAWDGNTKFTQSDQQSLAGHALTLFNAVKGYVPTDSRLTGVRISAFDAAGKVINGANVGTLLTPVAGTSNAANQMPAQMTITVSLRTGARGAAGRGRMFLPLNGPTITGTSGLIGSATKDGVGNGVKAFVQNIRAVGPLAAIVNRSKLTYSSIDDVQVGNFFDVQRRRENAKDETYTQYTPSLA